MEQPADVVDEDEPAPRITLTREHDQEVCESKVRYPTKADARTARDKLRREFPGASLYPCTNCRGFHITRVKISDERRRRRAARDGDLVGIHYDYHGAPGVTLEIGDGLRTRTGRTYLIVGLRVQETGKHKGRYHLQCAVNGEVTGTIYPLVWYARR